MSRVIWRTSAFKKIFHLFKTVHLTLKRLLELEAAVAAIKEGCDHLAEYGHLQYEFMEDHCEIAPNVFRTLWSDGTELICNYTDKPYTYKNMTVEPEGYRYF